MNNELRYQHLPNSRSVGHGFQVPGSKGSCRFRVGLNHPSQGGGELLSTSPVLSLSKNNALSLLRAADLIISSASMEKCRVKYMPVKRWRGGARVP